MYLNLYICRPPLGPSFFFGLSLVGLALFLKRAGSFELLFGLLSFCTSCLDLLHTWHFMSNFPIPSLMDVGPFLAWTSTYSMHGLLPM